MKNHRNTEKIKYRVKKRLMAIGLCVVTMGTMFAMTLSAEADIVTDNLQVLVGYYGMDLSEYVVLSDNHWSELEAALPTYEETFSYFNSGNTAKEYTAIVDAAHGFSVSDLLAKSNVYYGDIQSILFYVMDTQGIWTAFDRDQLFQTRYYFDDLPGHRTVNYGTKEVQQEVTKERVVDGVTEEYTEMETVTVTDPTKILSYTFDGAWDAAVPVEPMLSFEDNWAAFNEEFEHIGPDFSHMNAGTRFRLLFGQTSPTESMTRESAKYVSRVYITVKGQPVIGEMSDEIDGSLGSHEVTVQVKGAYNEGMRDALSEYMKLNSTNTNVLRIDGIDFNATQYSDMSSVTIHYSIIGEGDASISATIGGQELVNEQGVSLSTMTSTQGKNTPQDKEEEKDNDPSGGGSDGGNGNASGNSSSTDTSGSSAGTATSSDSQKKTSETSVQQAENQQTAPEKVKTSQVDQVAKTTRSSVFALTGDALGQLNQLQGITDPSVAAQENIDQIKVEDNSEEKQQEERMLLLFTGLGILGICLIGALAEYLSFRLRLKRKMIFM